MSSAAKRKAAALETGRETMSAARRTALGAQYPTYAVAPADSNIRIPTVQEPGERWAMSADEDARTQFLRTQHGSMGAAEREMAYNMRDNQGTEVWATGSPVLSGTYGVAPKKPAKRRLSGHTPGLKSVVAPGTTGALTEEHGTRDHLRVQAVEMTLSDPHRGDMDVAIMSGLATVQLMMSPREELRKARAAVTAAGAAPMQSVFASVGAVHTPAGFDRLADTVQEVRERKKMRLARLLHIAGYDELIPVEHGALLKAHKWNVLKAFKALRAGAVGKLNKSLYTQTDRLDRHSLRRMRDRKKAGKKQSRAMSPPRELPAIQPAATKKWW